MPPLSFFLRRIVAPRNLLRFVFICAVLTVIWYGFCLEERWRGQRAWAAYREAALARGAKLDLETVIPPAVPDTENFAAIPMIREIFAASAAGKPAPEWFAALKLKERPLPAFPGDTRDFSLAAWQKFFVEHGVLRAAGADPSSDVLAALNIVRPELDELHDAGRRPRAKFPVPWEKGFATPVPHLGPLLLAVRVQQLAVTAHLARGDSAAAYAVWRDSWRIHESLREEPVIISGLVRIHAVTSMLGSVYQGLAAGQWAAPEVEKLQADLARLRIVEDWQFAMVSERAVVNRSIDDLHRMRGGEVAKLVQILDGPERPPSPAGARLGVALYPFGWFYFSTVKINEYFDRAIARTETIRAGQRPQPIDELDLQLKREKARGTFRNLPQMLYLVFVPAVSGIEKTYLRCLVLARQATIACALERYRLAKGELPERLDVLMPEIVAEVPPDPMAGAPMHYRRSPSSGYALWSVALNGIDDGGRLGENKGATNQLDWVWRIGPEPIAR